MRNQILLGMMTVMNLLLPASIQSALSEDTETIQMTEASTEFSLASSFVKYLLETLPEESKKNRRKTSYSSCFKAVRK